MKLNHDDYLKIYEKDSKGRFVNNYEKRLKMLEELIKAEIEQEQTDNE